MAVEHGLLDFLVWSQQQTPPAPLEPYLTSVALRWHQAEILRWLKQKGLPWESHAYTDAIERGAALELLPSIYAETPRVPWDGYECAAAARNGRLDILQWLRTHGCPWSVNTCWYTAMDGELGILQWLRQHGCPWDIDHIVFAAIRYGQWPVLQWVLTQEQPVENMPTPQFVLEERDDIDHQTQYYQALAGLHTQHVYRWPSLQPWLDAVADVSRDVLNITLCSDLTRLVQTYC